MIRTLIILMFLYSNMAFAEDCTKNKAMRVGLSAIKEKIPDYEKDAPYKTKDNADSWLIYGNLPEGWRGGTPQVLVDKLTCEIKELTHGK